MNKAIMCLNLKRAYRPFPLHFLLRNLSTRSKKTLAGIPNYYEVLGIDQSASSDDIRDAFLKLSKQCHPDINSQDPTTHDRFVQVNEAYSVLSKTLPRRDYDLVLKSRESAQYHYRQHPGAERPYYHEGSSEFYDPQVFSMRDRSRDRYYENQPYYGVKGLSKVSNSHIVLTCFGIIIVGIIVHYFAVKRSSSLHIKTLNERDMKSHKLWQDANNPELFSQRLQTLRGQIQENEAKRKDRMPTDD